MSSHPLYLKNTTMVKVSVVESQDSKCLMYGLESLKASQSCFLFSFFFPFLFLVKCMLLI